MKISNSVMKYSRLFTFFLVALIGRTALADIGPGWYMQPLIIPSRPQKITTVQYPTVVRLQKPYNGPITALPQSTQPTEISEERTDEITSLARNLENDPKRIFDYVHNYIQYVHYFGSKKGAYLTFLEGSGNDFDQCALLVALLRAAKANNPAANNYTVSYQFGMMKIPYEAPDNLDLKHWLGLKLSGGPGNGDNDLDLINNLYYQAGFPIYQPNAELNLNRCVLVPWVGGKGGLASQADKTSFFVHRVWVKLHELHSDGSATDSYLDPAFKTANLIDGLDLSTSVGLLHTEDWAMGLNIGDLFADAKIPKEGEGPFYWPSTPEVTPNYVKDLNYSAISNRLVTYTANLLGQFQTTYKNISVDEVISGYRIQESETSDFHGLPFQPQNDAFDVDNFGSDPLKIKIPVLEWNNIPETYMSTLHLQIDYNETTKKYDVDSTYKFAELKGRKLTLTFTNKHSTISLDDVVDTTGTITTSATITTASMITSITNAFGTWDYSADSLGVVLDPDRAFQNDGVYGTKKYYRNAPGYVIAYNFDDATQLLTRRRQKLDALIRQGFDAQSPQVVTETLNVLGLSWFQQTYLAQRIIAGQNDILLTTLNRVGRVAQEKPTSLGFYIDITMQEVVPTSRSQPLTSAGPSRQTFFDMWAFAFSAMEHGVIEQLQPIGAASTIKTIYEANKAGQRLILLTPDNIKDQTPFNSYFSYANATGTPLSSTKVDELLSYVQPGVTLFVPGGTIPIGSWKGYGYVKRTLGSHGDMHIAMVIENAYGGYSASPTWIAPDPVNNTFLNSPTIFDLSSPLNSHIFGADPVNMLDGSFTVDSVDLSVGQPEPRGFSFSRHYDNNRRYYNDAKIGSGWTHNYSMKAAELSDPAAALGQTTPQAMAAFIVAMRAATAVYTANDTIVPPPWHGIGPPPPPPDPSTLVTAPLRWGVAALIMHWGIDQLKNNAVTIRLGKDALEFIKQPDGTYTPPAGAKMTLTKPAGYQLQMRHGNTFNFDAKSKQVTNIVDQYSKKMKFTYVGDRLNTVVDCWGRALKFGYDSATRLTSVSDGTRLVKFGYVQTNLTSVTDPESKTWTYQYDTNHNIIATKDPLARVITTSIYDNFGIVTQQWTQGDPAKAWNIYIAGNRVGVQKDPKGGKTTYYYDEKQRLVATKDANNNKTSSVYDGQDHVIQSITAKNEVTTFEYDGRQNLTQITDPLNKIATFKYDTDDTLTNYTDFHDIGTIGHGTTNEYNGKFLIRKITGPKINDASDNVVNFTYNETDGTLASRTDQEGKITSFQYDTHGEVSRVTYHNGDFETFVVNAQGDVTSRADGNGIVTQFEYNKRRQLTKTIVDPTAVNPSGLNIVTQIAYDDCGNVLRKTDALGNSVVSAYSSTQKLLTNQFPQLADRSVPMTVNHYDERDWLDFTENPLLDHGQTSYGYDSAGRLTCVQDPIRRTTRFGYDADSHKTSVTSPFQDTLGQFIQTTHFGYNDRGEQISLTDAEGSLIAYGHDSNGNPTTIQNRRNKTFANTYYGNNQIHTFQTPLLNTTTYRYVPRGMVASIWKPSNPNPLNPASTTFQYDDRGRLSTKADPVNLPSTPQTIYTYDKNNNLLTVSENGRTITRTYDHANRLQTYTGENGSVYGPVSYYYDKNGNLTNLVYPGNLGVTNFYDNLNRLTNVTDWAQRKTTFTYDIAGRLTSITRPNGAVRSLTYDNAGQLTDIEEQAPDGGILYRYLVPSSSYDGAGRQTSEFIYPSPTAFSATSVTATPNDDNQISTFQVSGSSAINVAHDADGNMTSGPLNTGAAVTYTYDARNRLIAVGGVSYTYDSEGSRLTMTQSGQTTFVNGPSGQALIRIRPNGSRTYYIYGPGLLYDVEMTSALAETGVRHTYHFDIRGSTVALTDNSSQVIERMSYGPYGALASGTPATDTPFLFNGRYGVMTDPNGLLYMQARYYNPYICRFINSDPSGFSGGMNFYAYANGNPVSLVDPFGLGAFESDRPSWFDEVATGLGFDMSHQAGEQRAQFARGMLNLVTLGLANDASVAFTGRDLSGEHEVRGVERGLAAVNLAAAVLPLLRIENVASKVATFAADAAESTAVDLQATLQAQVDRAVSEIGANPGLAKNLMSEGSYRHLVEGTQLADASYGKAIERLVARNISADETLSSMFSYQSKPFVKTPDFFGWEGQNLRLFDLTTQAKIPSHLARPYGSYTEFVTHPGLPANLIFPR